MSRVFWGLRCERRFCAGYSRGVKRGAVNFLACFRHYTCNLKQMTLELHDVGSLYRQHGAEILNYLARRCPADEACDLLQETFLQVVKHGEKLRSVAMPRAWLFGIARNILAHHYRQQPETPTEISTETSAPAAEDARLPAMREAIAALAPELRETLELRIEQELSYEEIAGVLAIPVGTVRSRLHNAVRRLRTALTNPEQIL